MENFRQCFTNFYGKKIGRKTNTYEILFSVTKFFAKNPHYAVRHNITYMLSLCVIKIVFFFLKGLQCPVFVGVR